MLSSSTPLYPAPPPSGPFTHECDACEAKEVTATPALPTGWTEDVGPQHHLSFCPDCSTADESVQ